MSRLAELLAATPAIVETFLLDGRRGRGKPSRWVTLRAMRVLRWWES
jgi:hypothetical protein